MRRNDEMTQDMKFALHLIHIEDLTNKHIDCVATGRSPMLTREQFVQLLNELEIARMAASFMKRTGFPYKWEEDKQALMLPLTHQ